MTPWLEAHELVVRHGARSALDRASLELFGGEIVALVGPNASGKTTLLEVLLGARRPDEGMVRLGGVPLESLSAPERARQLTLVPQSSEVRFALRFRDLVAMGRTPYLGRFGGLGPEDERSVTAALDLTDTRPLATRSVTAISGGERQRAHLARAFAQQPRVLLLDEPTANLDLCHQLEALAIVRDFVERGGAAIVALHDLTLAGRWADRVVLMRAGRIVRDGPPETVLRPDLLADVFGVQTTVHRDAEGRFDHVVVLGPVQGYSSMPGSGRVRRSPSLASSPVEDACSPTRAAHPPDTFLDPEPGGHP